jgi:hypothetical protein
MDPRIIAIAERYRASGAERGRAGEFDELVRLIAQQRNARLIDAVSCAAAIGALSADDEVKLSLVTPAMKEAFQLAFPNTPLESLSDRSPEEISGFINAWKGKYFEVLVRDRLNAGEWVGDIHLEHGQTAELAADVSQPGWDLRIVNADGSLAEAIQLKATSSLGYVKEALENYPDFQIVATDEVADIFGDTAVHASGFANQDLTDHVSGPLADLMDSDIGELLDVLPFLPFVIITTMDGKQVIDGGSSIGEALERTKRRAIRSGSAIAVGKLVSLLPIPGAPALAMGAAASTRIAIDRLFSAEDIAKLIDSKAQELVTLHEVYCA